MPWLDRHPAIAGELHDVVAHALSAMTIQATGARRFALTRPELALEAFGAIETAGRCRAASTWPRTASSRRP